MNQNSRISWTAFSTYEKCPQLFLWKYGWDQIPKKPKPEVRSAHAAIMGRVVQEVVEDLYNNELYRLGPALKDELSSRVLKAWKKQTRDPRNHIDVAEAGMSEGEMIAVCQDGVLGYLRTMKEHKLLGEYCKAEVEMVGWIDKWNCVYGYADLIFRREDTGVTIIDGKNTRHKMKYTDPDQLLFYGMLFKLSFGQSPDRMGFVWYRFPYGDKYNDPETGELKTEPGIEWVEFSEEDFKGIALRVQEARKGMRYDKFPAKPSPEGCRWCDYLSVCEARQAQIVSNGGGKKRPKAPIEELSAGGGFADFSM